MASFYFWTSRANSSFVALTVWILYWFRYRFYFWELLKLAIFVFRYDAKFKKEEYTPKAMRSKGKWPHLLCGNPVQLLHLRSFSYQFGKSNEVLNLLFTSWLYFNFCIHDAFSNVEIRRITGAKVTKAFRGRRAQFVNVPL